MTRLGIKRGRVVGALWENLLKESTRGRMWFAIRRREFAFVLAGRLFDARAERAELLREEIKQLNVRHGGQPLGAVDALHRYAVFPTTRIVPRAC